MDSGKATGTAASVEMLAADRNRGSVAIMLYDDTASIAIGLDKAAVADEGVILREIGSSVVLLDEAARAQINIIGNGGIVTYQTGPVLPGYVA